MAQTVTVLGATGSIGQNTLRVIAESNGELSVSALTAMENVEQLIADALTFRPRLAVVGNPAHDGRLKEGLAGSGVEAASGEAALTQAAAMDADTVVSAIVGAAGLQPTLAAISRGAKVALANKECLVMAGALMQAAAAKSGAVLLPVDSEHNAIFQVLDAEHPEWVERVTITASGGPFREWTIEQMRAATPEQAVRHPNWAMGAKISVDSATLMNKGLELIEAYRLFPLKIEQLSALVHPESIVHSLVAYCDGSVLVQMAMPDMRTPIAHALAWPARMKISAKPLDLAALSRLHFYAPDVARFPALSLAFAAMKAGDVACITLNAANEVAVGAFLSRRIGFLDIVKIVEQTLEKAQDGCISGLDDIMAADALARRAAEALIATIG